MFRVRATPNFNWHVYEVGDDETRIVALFYQRSEADNYATWRNNNQDEN